MLWALALAALPPAAHAATVVGSYTSWTLYRDDSAGAVCFLAATPSDQTPPGAQRNAPRFYISSWVKEGVKAEISVRLGFPMKKGLEPILTVSGRANDPLSPPFKMFFKDDKAFIADPTTELKLLDTMKKGSKLTIEATSDRGTAVTDTYPLAGITAALQALAGGCK